MHEPHRYPSESESGLGLVASPVVKAGPVLLASYSSVYHNCLRNSAMSSINGVAWGVPLFRSLLRDIQRPHGNSSGIASSYGNGLIPYSPHSGEDNGWSTTTSMNLGHVEEDVQYYLFEQADK
ncbi:uncharacterized protein HD556DRAFT_1314051 [Suillus plorans]|uniref:Uncharacterized protein n=1 Tax=Suillus plorans TaxID=116603 RepID=A0A9P7AAU6_9AGAM|nr:uncharacterized protein HD556DRAFT_1314051 [Suillus plorans]KAG1785695.1 hypothetical protein HD556DRAFT_1314051 [Suillus plorans]